MPNFKKIAMKELLPNPNIFSLYPVTHGKFIPLYWASKKYMHCSLGISGTQALVPCARVTFTLLCITVIPFPKLTPHPSPMLLVVLSFQQCKITVFTGIQDDPEYKMTPQ